MGKMTAISMTDIPHISVDATACPAHDIRAAVLLYLLARGPGALSIDHWIARQHGTP